MAEIILLAAGYILGMMKDTVKNLTLVTPFGFGDRDESMKCDGLLGSNWNENIQYF